MDKALLILTCLVASVTELRTRRVPNWLTVSSLGLALVWSICGESARLPSTLGLQERLMGAAALFLVMLWAYLPGAVGGGDVKLAAAIGGWAGFTSGITVLFYAFLFSAGIGLLKLAWKGKVYRELIHPVFDWFGRLWKCLRKHPKPPKDSVKKRRRETVPFAIAALLGAIWTYALPILHGA